MYISHSIKYYVSSLHTSYPKLTILKFYVVGVIETYTLQLSIDLYIDLKISMTNNRGFGQKNDWS